MDKKNVKKMQTISLVIVGLVLSIMVLYMLFSPSRLEDLKVNIFADISECENLLQSENKGAKFVKYDTPSKDKKLKNLEYESFFAGEYSCSDFEFTIFAYEFKNEDDAKAYFENHTGKESEKNANFSINMGIGGYRLRVFHNSMAYSVTSSSRKDAEKIEAFLGENFSVDVLQIFSNENT